MPKKTQTRDISRHLSHEDPANRQFALKIVDPNDGIRALVPLTARELDWFDGQSALLG